VNLIPYNPTGMYDGSTSKAIAAFKAALDRARLPATVQASREGATFRAACGQLAACRPADGPGSQLTLAHETAIGQAALAANDRVALAVPSQGAPHVQRSSLRRLALLRTRH